MTADSQEEIVAFLSAGAGLGPAATRIRTHAAWIFLIGTRAFKMKRAVRFAFLDFSRLADRHRALAAELRLNRRTAPALYRRLVAVTRRADGALELDGTGAPVEWLLEMARFDQDELLDRRARAGTLAPATIDALASEIAAFHARAAPRPDLGGVAAMATVIDGNALDLNGLTGAVFAPDQVAALNARSRVELERQSGLLERRRGAGQVRHCHGDLHLENIILHDGRPLLFDCLEFDEDLATIDVIYDLAFLIMDLCHRDLGALGQRLLTTYLDATGDDAGVALLPLFLSCRAAIRAKIHGLTATIADGPTTAQAEITTARAYLDQALACLAPSTPVLVAIGGLSGTGKSTVARSLAPGLGPAPGAVVVRSDVVRKRRFGVAPTERLPAEAYRSEVTVQVYATLAERARTLLAAGHGVIVDAVFLRPEERGAIEAVARAAEVPFLGIWLEAPEAQLAERIARRHGDASDATVEVMNRQARLDPGPIDWSVVDASGAPAALAATIRELLATG